MLSSVKLELHGSSFLVASSWHPRRHARHGDILARMSSVLSVLGVSGDFPVHLATCLPDRSTGGLLRCIVLPVCPCVVSFSKCHEPDTSDFLRTISRVCHEDASRKLLLWNLSFSTLQESKQFLCVLPSTMFRRSRYYSRHYTSRSSHFTHSYNTTLSQQPPVTCTQCIDAGCTAKRLQNRDDVALWAQGTVY